MSIKSTSRCGLDLSQSDRNPVASVDSGAIDLDRIVIRLPCGQALHNSYIEIGTLLDVIVVF